MRRNFALGLIAATLFLSNGTYAFAQASSSTTTAAPADATAKPEEKPSEKVDKKADKKPDEKKGNTKKASSGDGIGAIPAHIASFAVGTMVGIPVSIFRKSKTETINATKDLVGDTENKFLLGAAGILGVPAGVLSGSMQGFFYGPMNAWKGTADEPFSEEAFSLGDAK